MKKGLLTILSIVTLVILFACVEGGLLPIKIDGDIIGVLPQHATRVMIVYQNHNGKIVDKSIHQSEVVTDGKITVNPRDYLPLYCQKTCKPYRFFI
jgi:hypothetical protein